MARRANGAAGQPRDLVRMRQRLDDWRGSHKRGTAFGSKLWSAAGRVARRHGVYVTSRTLGLEYNKLKAMSGESIARGRGKRELRARPGPATVDSTALQSSLREWEPLTVVQVRRTPAESLFNSLMQAHHYLGYARPVGEHLKFTVYAGSRPVALFAWSSAPRHLGPRDRFLGWSPAVRRQNIAGIAYNTRFLILPWIKVQHLASHLLGRMTRLLSAEWQRVYGHPVHFAETFIDRTRYRGTCYRAANWQYLGQTQGRGKDDLTHRVNRTLKDILGLALCSDFRERLLHAP